MQMVFALLASPPRANSTNQLLQSSTSPMVDGAALDVSFCWRVRTGAVAAAAITVTRCLPLSWLAIALTEEAANTSKSATLALGTATSAPSTCTGGGACERGALAAGWRRWAPGCT